MICVRAVGKLSLYSGVISLGVGDSMAAVAGSLFGKLQWPGMDHSYAWVHVLCNRVLRRDQDVC